MLRLQKHNVSYVAVNDKHIYHNIYCDLSYNTYIGVLPEREDERDVLGGDGLPSVYYVKRHPKNRFIHLNNKRDILMIGGFVTAPYRTKTDALIDIIYLPFNKPFATNGKWFKSNG